MSAIEKAIEYIRQKGSARSPELSDLLGIRTTDVMSRLLKPVQDGYLVTCKVTAPGTPPVNEYRLSATISDSKVSWGEFKISRSPKLREKPLSQPKPRPPRLPEKPSSLSTLTEEHRQPIREKKPAKTTTPCISETLSATPSLHSHEPIVIPELSAIELTFMVDSNGKLRIEHNGKTTTLSNEQTRSVGELLVATETIWS